MGPLASDRIALNAAAQIVLRLFIASYFMATALGIVPGTELGVLFSAVLAPMAASILAGAIVFLLSFMIMIALHTRLAALLLGLMTFYASYLTMISLGVADELGDFWRDLTLVAALMLTYGGSAGADGPRPRRLWFRHVAPRRVTAQHHTPRRALSAVDAQRGADVAQSASAQSPRSAKATDEVDNIFVV
jgi:uncharacterized membrane protein YphA (DoxX/SURF4 family)